MSYSSKECAGKGSFICFNQLIKSSRRYMEQYCVLQVISPLDLLRPSCLKFPNKSNEWITNINSAHFQDLSTWFINLHVNSESVATNYLLLSYTMCSGWWVFSVFLCRLGPCGLCPLYTWGGIRQCLNYGAYSTPVSATWALQQGSFIYLRHGIKSCNYEALSLFLN